MKKVIFIGGVSYSGTTLFDMILANDVTGFSCGELSSLFYKRREHHQQYECGCGSSECKIWKNVITNGKSKIYDTLFKIFPNVNFIVDSSKDPIWINEQMDILRKSDIQSKNILIYKTPIESAYSFQKRGRFKIFEPSWINYHRLYFTLIKDFFTIKYADLVSKEDLLPKICDSLEIPYFESKLKYWEKTHHTLFGNTSAKIHLFNRNEQGFLKHKNELEKSGRDVASIEQEYKQIYYQKVNDENLLKCIKNIYENNTNFGLINKYLGKKQIISKKIDGKDNRIILNNLKLSKLQLQFRKVKRAYYVNRFKFFSISKN
ncbi:hypothetical protein [Desulfosarcina variabilis]|uniref:hypothetical protein n=1 Tax=Desulfosarcina variabilis TaxID=2300 RepID=UPI003AFAE072